jgi:hypothetical protein
MAITIVVEESTGKRKKPAASMAAGGVIAPYSE